MFYIVLEENNNYTTHYPNPNMVFQELNTYLQKEYSNSNQKLNDYISKNDFLSSCTNIGYNKMTQYKDDIVIEWQKIALCYSDKCDKQTIINDIKENILYLFYSEDKYKNNEYFKTNLLEMKLPAITELLLTASYTDPVKILFFLGVSESTIYQSFIYYLNNVLLEGQEIVHLNLVEIVSNFYTDKKLQKLLLEYINRKNMDVMRLNKQAYSFIYFCH